MKTLKIHSYLLTTLKMAKVNFQLVAIAALVFTSFSVFAQDVEPVVSMYFVGGETEIEGDVSQLQLKGATITAEGLEVSPGKWAKAGYTGSKAITEKTIVSLAKVKSLTGGGSIFSMDHTNKDEFDGIVMGERRAGQWFAGSSSYRRTDFGSKFTETVNETVVMFITYKNEGGKCRVSVYRNGELLDTYVKGALATYQSNVEFLFGPRHTGGNRPIGGATATIMGVAMFDVALDAAMVKELSEEVMSEINGGGADATYKVGDIHPDGGIVMSVSADGKHGMMIMEKDMGKMSHDDAQAAVKGLGDGWELPSWQYLKEIYTTMHKTGIIEFHDDYYWSSWRPNTEFAKYTRFSDGYTSDGPARNEFYVRPVKRF